METTQNTVEQVENAAVDTTNDSTVATNGENAIEDDTEALADGEADRAIDQSMSSHHVLSWHLKSREWSADIRDC